MFIHKVVNHVFVVVLLVIIVYRRRQQPEQYIVGIDPDDDVRENIIHYDEEGVGEYYVYVGNCHCYDIDIVILYFYC